MTEVDYTIAFREVVEILKRLQEEDYIKVPLEMIEVLEDNANPDYEVHYDPKIPLDKQNISNEAKVIIALFFKTYWADEKQKEIIENYDRAQLNILEILKSDQYGSDVFKKEEADKDVNLPEVPAVKTSFIDKLKEIVNKILHKK